MKEFDQSERLRGVILSDRSKAAHTALCVLKSDILRLINDYLNVREENLRIALAPEGDGYILKVFAYADRIYDAGNIITP